MGCHTAMTTITTTLILLAGLSHSHSQAYRGRWGFRPSWNNFRSPFSLPRPEPEPEPFRRRIFSPTFSSPFAEPEPEPEPEPSSRARFGGSFSRRFFDARVRAPVKPRPPVPPVPPSPPAPRAPPAISESVEVKLAETLEESQPVIEPRSLALPLQDFPV